MKKKIDNLKGFWGLCLESGKRYTIILKRTIKITNAALGTSKLNLKDKNIVFIKDEENSTITTLTTLYFGKNEQQRVRTIIEPGRKITLFIKGSYSIYITGFYLYSFVEENGEDILEITDEINNENVMETENMQLFKEEPHLIAKKENISDIKITEDTKKKKRKRKRRKIMMNQMQLNKKNL